jgi:hypothetical protein
MIKALAFTLPSGETTAFATGCHAPDAHTVTIVWLLCSGTSVRLSEYPTADAGIPHELERIGSSLGEPLARYGPPKVPFAFRVSLTRQGFTVTMRNPCA